MHAHHAETIVAADGSVTVANVPFEHGQRVEVFVLTRSNGDGNSSSDEPSPSEKPLIYHDPFEPAVPPEDWEALR